MAHVRAFIVRRPYQGSYKAGNEGTSSARSFDLKVPNLNLFDRLLFYSPAAK